MRYNFETKATKEYAAKLSKYAEEDAYKVAPTPFSFDYELEEVDVIKELVSRYKLNLVEEVIKGRKFSCIGEALDLITPILHRETLLLSAYIRINIKYNSNYIELTEKNLISFMGLQRDKVYDAINEAIKYKIIAKTTRKSIYVVNHNMIFKGKFKEFYNTYIGKYGKPCNLDVNGKVVLER